MKRKRRPRPVPLLPQGRKAREDMVDKAVRVFNNAGTPIRHLRRRWWRIGKREMSTEKMVFLARLQAPAGTFD